MPPSTTLIPMAHQPSTASVQTWIDRARRAQQLFAQVDLEKIVEHDPEEFEKLSKVSRAIESICSEEDKPAATLPDMTDPIEEAPTLDEHDQKRSELMSVLDATGYGDRLGRIYLSNFDDPIRPLGSSHTSRGCRFSTYAWPRNTARLTAHKACLFPNKVSSPHSFRTLQRVTSGRSYVVAPMMIMPNC